MRDGEKQIDADDVEIQEEGTAGIESDENEINIYYEPTEIEANRRDQNKDQFADLLQMRRNARDINTKVNIMDFIPEKMK